MWRPDPLRTTLVSCQSLIWMAGWLVPRSRRTAWKTQWLSKVWHWAHFLAESGRFDAANRMALARHCWGAFPDAFWQRFDREDFFQRRDRLLLSPATCLVFCCVLLVGVVLGGGFIPRLMSMLSAPVAHADRVAVVSFDAKYTRLRSGTLQRLTSVWQESPLLSELATYSWGSGKFNGDSGPVTILEAQVTPGFFNLLNVHAQAGRLLTPEDASSCVNCVVLSYDFWKMRFHGDPRVMGQQVVIDGQQRIVIGVLPRNFRMISSSVSVWTMLQPWFPTFTNFMSRTGAVALMKYGVNEVQLQRDLVNRTENDGYRGPAEMIRVASLQEQARKTTRNYTALLLLAFSCAAGIAWMLRSGTEFGQASLSTRDQLRWWGFFLAKSAALVGSAYLSSWMIVHAVSAYLIGSIFPMADQIAIWVFLPLAVAVLSWSMIDQQKRCRVCLRRLVMPVDIGRPGCVLLNWAGTEMVCPEGHGTLYVPESPANWLERNRWSTLDESWASLFRTP